MARKGKDKPKPGDCEARLQNCAEFVPRADSDIAHCARCGKFEGEHVTAQLDADNERRSAAEARIAAKVEATAPTTLCTDHVVDSETPPYFCALCGKPLPTEAVEKALKAAANKGAEFKLGRDRTDDWEERIDAARQSEKRDETLDEWAPFDPERQAAAGAVLTKLRLDAILDGDDTPLDWFTVAIEQPWLDRLKQLAAKAGMSEPKYVEQLIKRQWIASGGGKS